MKIKSFITLLSLCFVVLSSQNTLQSSESFQYTVDFANLNRREGMKAMAWLSELEKNRVYAQLFNDNIKVGLLTT